jgi:hypothetical protein
MMRGHNEVRSSDDFSKSLNNVREKIWSWTTKNCRRQIIFTNFNISISYYSKIEEQDIIGVQLFLSLI